MWMMGYNEAGDSFSGRKLRTLMPRPAAATPTNPPCLGRIHGSDLLSFNHHLGTLTEQGKREFNAQQVVVSSRWNPTPEQLQTLEELYRRGTRTPSAEQIQHITAQLRRYGKIEGKNVFYWFQNHKARERQKRRRQLESNSDEQPHNMENMERKESGANGTGLEVERTKNWASPTNCSSTLAERTVSMQRAAKAAIPECSADGWVQFGDAELQQRKSLDERNATWQMMQFLGSSSPTNIMNSSSSSSSSFTSATTIPAAATVRRSKQLKPHNLNFFLTPYEEDNLINLDDSSIHDGSNCESQTLQLFPLQSSQENFENGGEKSEAENSVSEMNTTTTTPQKFFEFLPLRN